MKRLLSIVALAAWAGSPLAAPAQPAPGGDGGPPPGARAKLEPIAAAAKADSYAALSPDHRAQVQAIVAKVAAGSVEPRAAGAQIDAVLTPDEAKAVLAIGDRARTQMRAAMGGATAPPPPPEGRRGPPTAGAFLVRVSLTPEQMRALRGNGPPPGQQPPP